MADAFCSQIRTCHFTIFSDIIEKSSWLYLLNFPVLYLSYSLEKTIDSPPITGKSRAWPMFSLLEGRDTYLNPLFLSNSLLAIIAYFCSLISRSFSDF